MEWMVIWHTNSTKDICSFDSQEHLMNTSRNDFNDDIFIHFIHKIIFINLKNIHSSLLYHYHCSFLFIIDGNVLNIFFSQITTQMF